MVGLVFSVAVAGCSATTDRVSSPNLQATSTSVPQAEGFGTTTTTSAPTTLADPPMESGGVTTAPYRQPDGAAPTTVDVYQSEADGPTVVLLHGWGPGGESGPAVDLGPFAERVAALGAIVMYFHWHTNDGFSAASAADLSCIGGFVAARAASYGGDPDSVLVIGHSMGAETGSKLALSSFGLDPNSDCVEAGRPPDPYAFVGIGGSYGLLAQPLDRDLERFAVRNAPTARTREISAEELVVPGLTAADAYEIDGYSGLPSDNPLAMVLVVGANDSYEVTNPDVTAAFASALGSSGTQVEVIEVPRAGHEDVMDPDTEAGLAILSIVADILAGAP